MKKCISRSLLAGLMVVCLFAANPVNSFAAVIPDPPVISPQYTGIYQYSVDLDISSLGYASCYGAVSPNSGYSVDLTMELQQDGTTIKTWTDSGSLLLILEKGQFVEKRHYYQVVLTVDIKNSKGVIVSSPSLRSNMLYYS